MRSCCLQVADTVIILSTNRLLRSDGGRIIAGSGLDPDMQLEIFFDGTRYEADYRTPISSVAPWPDWLNVGAVDVFLQGLGSPQAGAFLSEMVLAEMPEITTPSTDEASLEVDPSGHFSITWIPTPADEIQVVLSFNLDWDNSAFRCFPPQGAGELRLPFEWIEQWTWEYGELMVVARNEQVVAATIRTRTHRIQQQGVHFVMWE